MRIRRSAWIVAVASTVLWLSSYGITHAQSSSTAVAASFSGLVYNRATQSFNSVLTLTNNGHTLYSPLTITIATGSPAVTVGGAGNIGNNTFSTVPSLPNGSLLPGESHTLVVAFLDPTRVGFTPTVTSVRAAAAPAGLGITVTTPTSGQTSTGPTFLVAGALTAPGVAGASVDGVAACVVGSYFFINAFQPLFSPTTFTASAADIDGGQQSTTVGIIANTKGLRVVPGPTCGGIAPLTESFTITLDTTDGDTIASESIDFGAGAGAVAVQSGTPVQNVYKTAGLYTVTVTAITTLGVTLRQKALVSVQTPAQAFAPAIANLSLLSSALDTGQIVRALSYHTYAAQAHYATALTQNGINLSALSGLLTTALPVLLAGDYLEMAIATQTATGRQSSSIVMVRDGSGIWRVDSW